jgi:hypothetical protein
MKKYLLLLTVMVMAVPFMGFAEEKTLAGDGFESGGYGGPVFKFISLGGNTGVLSGGRGGWIINHTFVIGGGGYSLLTDIPIEGNDLRLNYGGFEVEYIYRSDAVVHFTVHVGLGGGNVTYKNTNDSDKFFYIEPTLNGEVNILKWFRINAGIGYLWVDKIQNMPSLSSSDVRGITGTIVFKLGGF